MCISDSHPEGVDRNEPVQLGNSPQVLSPSTRRAWIEIAPPSKWRGGGVSPSTRRAWIEIVTLITLYSMNSSPSTRRAWIEIETVKPPNNHREKSPSTRRAWIEIAD